MGYGFNDRHIQPKLRKRVLTEGVPIVILASTLTENARKFILECKHKLFLGAEKSNTGCKAYFPEEPKGVEIPIPLWELDCFLTEVIGK